LSKLFQQISHSRKKVVACISIFAHLSENSRFADKKMKPPRRLVAILPWPTNLTELPDRQGLAR